MTHIRPALVLLALFTLLTGIAYPLAVTGIGQTVLPNQANGSLIKVDGKVVGSSLIGQSFTGPNYFWPRPSAAGNGYDGAASSGSNLGPTSQALIDRTQAHVGVLRQSGISGPIPADLATASASGLDPHISPQAAGAQVARIAASRGMSAQQVEALVAAHTDQPSLGVLGAPAVNVLTLNLALDRVNAAK
jgi:K+-transporting ATPase ATPase C chain